MFLIVILKIWSSVLLNVENLYLVMKQILNVNNSV